MSAVSILARIAGLLTLAFAPAAAHAETVRLSVGDTLARFALLTPGTHRYVRYVVTGPQRLARDIWSRTVSFEPHDGRSALHITQRWDEAADKAVLLQDSWFETLTFTPLTHMRRVEREAGVKIGGFRFTPSQVTATTGLPQNDRQGFVKALPQPSYNFEYDMELIQTLPLGKGRVFDIPFYDPGQDEPGRYLFKVVGSGVMPGEAGRLVDCWIVTADYNTGKVVSRFWFAKSGQLMLREAQVQKDGSFLIKSLLQPEPSDGTG